MPVVYNRIPEPELNKHLRKLRIPIGDALEEYLAGTDLSLDIKNARKLKIDPGKPNSARSQTPLKLGEEVLGDLFAIAFQAGDGSGDEKHGYTRAGIYAPTYTNKTAIVPRKKDDLHSEVHLPLLRQWLLDGGLDQPDYLHGSLDLLGLSEKTVDGKPELITLGHLGHEPAAKSVGKVATYTLRTREATGGSIERRGDPHAVYDSMPYFLQIAAFFAMTDAMAKRYPDLLKEAFNPQNPIQY